MLVTQYKDASIVMVVFDINNKESFKSCAKWYQDVTTASLNHNLPGLLAGESSPCAFFDSEYSLFY